MKVLGSLLVLSLFVSGSAYAAWVPVGEGGDPVSVTVLESAPERTVLEILVGGFDLQSVNIDGSPFSVLTLPGEGHLLEAGLPEVPVVCRSVVIPDRALMRVRVLEQDSQDLSLPAVAPSKGNLLRTVNPAEVPYEFDAFYRTDSWYPADVVTHREPYVLRDFRGLTVVVHPFQVNPASGLVRVSTRLVVEVAAIGMSEVNVIDRREPPRQVSCEFARIYGEHFVNYAAMARYSGIEEQGGMLVITYDDFRPAMEPFVRWKNEMGMRTRMFDVSGIGTDPAVIKDFIRAYRDTVPDMVYVLLVGDAAQVPPMHAMGDASDPRYSLLDGDDDYPDILVGRFSAQTLAHAETQALRSVNYEKLPQWAGWYNQGCGIGSAEGPGDDGEMDREHIDNIRTDLLGYTYTLVDQIYDPGATSGQVSAVLNGGRSILNYCGHGSTTSWGTTGFSVTRVNQLTNDNKLPFIFDVACLNGNFEDYTCFAEAWLRAKNPSTGNPTGAVGIYASSINQSWDPPMCAQDEMNDLLVQDEKRTFGGLCYHGSMQMIDEYGGDGATMFKTWHVFGDPSLRVRTDTPQAMTVNHSGEVSSGATTYTVVVPGVEGALCGLSYVGQYLGSGITGPDGTATVWIEAALPVNEDLLLTVTAYNRLPQFGTVSVTDRTETAEAVRSPEVETALGNFPNPFNPETTVSFSLATASRVEIDVYTVTGAHVASLLGGDLPAGAHRVVWDGRDAEGNALAAGVYLCRLKAGDQVLTHKMVVAK